MLKAGMMERIIDLANAVVGRVRGGLAHVTMLAGLGLSTVSGAAVADASALGSTMIPSLRKVYGVGFSSAVVAAAANLGPIIPPSGAMIVYAFMAGPTVSVGGMFMAGVVPGLILVMLMMGACSVIAIKRNYPLTGDSFSIVRIFHELKRSVIIMLMPVVGSVASSAARSLRPKVRRSRPSTRSRWASSLPASLRSRSAQGGGPHCDRSAVVGDDRVRVGGRTC
jgi:TRAP-type C4-dicarboxylate transport system permease large subunit